jgi:hypothetical protein
VGKKKGKAMKTNPKRLLNRIPLCLVALSCALLIGGSSIASARMDSSKMNYPSNADQRDENIAKVLYVLEDRCEAPGITEKLKDKLLTMSDKQIRLIASLADLISKNGHIAGTDISLFVITVLVIGS